MDQALCALDGKRLARTDLLVEFTKSALEIIGLILLKGGNDLRLFTEQIDNLGVSAYSEGADQRRNRDFAGTVYTHVKYVVGIRFVFQPRTSVRNNRAGVKRFSEFIAGDPVINTGTSDQLADDDTLGSVDHKRAGLSHQRKISHKDLMLTDLVVLLVMESHPYLQRSRIGRVSLRALLNGVLDIIPADFEGSKFKAELSAVIFDWRNVV